MWLRFVIDVSFSLFPYLHSGFKFKSFGNRFFINMGLIWVPFSFNWASKGGLGPTMEPESLQVRKMWISGALTAPFRPSLFDDFPTMYLNYFIFLVFDLHVRFLCDFLWILGPMEPWKSCKTIGGSHKIKVSHIQKKWGSRFNFRVILGVILEPFGSQNQIFSDSVGISFLGQQNYGFRGQNWLWAGPGNST